jgi:hypothetical protein
MKAPSNQLPLFDESGMPPVDYGLAAIAGQKDGADFKVEGMVFHVAHDGNHVEVISDVLEGLGILHQHRDLTFSQSWLNGVGNLDISTWYTPLHATIRREKGHQTIDVIQRGKGVEVNLPHPDLWSTHGLDWIRNFQNCCERNRANTSPWLGACCGCTPCV